MASKTKLYFATDIHGSERCFRKFLNAGAAYGPDVMVLGGDVAGKAVQAIEDLGRGHDLHEAREHVRPRAHVARLLLHPDDLLEVRVARDELAHLRLGERI